MSQNSSPTRSPDAQATPALQTSKVVTRVFDEILEAINLGRLRPGQRLSDELIAADLGVSRTPVREAFQRLRELGIVEASASRFTRVALVTPRQTAEAMTVWIALAAPLVEEVVPRASPELREELRAHHEAFVASAALGDIDAVAMENFAFFGALTAASANAALQRAITSVVHIVRLGSMHLPERLDLAAISHGQSLILEAVEAHDRGIGQRAIEVLRGVEIPQDEPATS